MKWIDFSGVGFLKLVGIGFQLAISALFARFLGAANFGTYVFLMSIAFLISSPLQMAVNTFAVRWHPRYKDSSKSQLARYIVGYGNSFVLWSCLIVLIAVTTLVAAIVKQGALIPLTIGIFASLMILTEWNNGLIRASHWPGHSLISESVVRPLALICIIALAALVVHQSVMLNVALIAQCASVLLAVVLTYLIRAKKANLTTAEMPRGIARRTLRVSMLGYLAQGIVTAIQAQGAVILLWFIGNSSDVGYLKLAMQLSMVSTLGLSIAQMTIASRFAQALADSNQDKAIRLFNSAAKFGLVLGTPVLVMYVFFAPYIITILFGDEYAPAAIPLIILSAAQFLNLLTGPVGTALNMSGRQKQAIVSIIIGMFAQLVLGAVLEIHYGVIGMASGVALGIVLMNISLLVFCWLELRIVPFK